MRILIVHSTVLPVFLYGGTERVIWCLGRDLVRMGHEVTFLLKQGSTCDFAPVLHIDDRKPIEQQVPAEFDVAHFHVQPDAAAHIRIPYVVTMHGNLSNAETALDRNSIFVSRNHAERFGSRSWVHNGLDWDDYPPVNLAVRRDYFHFLGKAAWRVKNVQGAIDIVRRLGSERLLVLGGHRFNVNMGLRLTLSPKIRFKGMVGGAEKAALLNGSRGLIFPVRWHEPFGLAIIESLYFGCPVFGTPYGSLPELVPAEYGYLSSRQAELAEAVRHWAEYSPVRCHEYARDTFDSASMTIAYLAKYEMVANGALLNDVSPRLREPQRERFLEWR